MSATVVNAPRGKGKAESLASQQALQGLANAGTTAEFLDRFVTACETLNPDERFAVTVRVMHHSFLDGVELGKLLGISDRDLIFAMARKDVHRNRPDFRKAIIGRMCWFQSVPSKPREEVYALSKSNPEILDGAPTISTAKVIELETAAALFFSRFYSERTFKPEDKSWTLQTRAVKRALEHLKLIRPYFSSSVSASSFVNGIWQELRQHPRFEQATRHAWKNAVGNRTLEQFRRETIDPGSSPFPGSSETDRKDVVLALLREPLPQTIDEKELSRLIRKLKLSPSVEDSVRKSQRASHISPLEYWALRNSICDGLQADLRLMLENRECREVKITKDLDGVYQVTWKIEAGLTEFDWSNPTVFKLSMEGQHPALIECSHSTAWEQSLILTERSILVLTSACNHNPAWVSHLHDLSSGKEIEFPFSDCRVLIRQQCRVGDSVILICEVERRDSQSMAVIEVDALQKFNILLEDENLGLCESLDDAALIYRGTSHGKTGSFMLFDQNGLRPVITPRAETAVFVGDTPYVIVDCRLYTSEGDEVSLPGPLTRENIIRTKDGALVLINNIVYRLSSGKVEECFRSDFDLKLMYGAHGEAIIAEVRKLNQDTVTRFFSSSAKPLLGGRAFFNISDAEAVTPDIFCLYTDSPEGAKFVDRTGIELAAVGHGCSEAESVTKIGNKIIFYSPYAHCTIFNLAAVSSRLKHAEQAILDLLNVISNPTKHRIDAIIESFEDLNNAGSIDDSPVVARFISDILREAPLLFADDLIAVKNNDTDETFEQLSWLIPDHFRRRLDSRRGGDSYSASAPEFFCVEDYIRILSGDPTKDSDIPFVVTPEVSGVFVIGRYDRCDANGLWHISSLPEVVLDVEDSTVLHCKILNTGEREHISLPQIPGASLQDIQHTYDIKTPDLENHPVELSDINNYFRLKQYGNASISYTQLVPRVKQEAHEISQIEYDTFRSELVREHGSYLCEPLVKSLPIEMQRFLDSITKLPPLEKLHAIEDWVLSVQVYDMGNGSLAPDKELLSASKRLEQMMLRARQLRIQGVQEANGKLFAGVCVDFARDLSVNLCRAAGFAAGIARGISVEAGGKKYRHAEAYVYWPNPDGSIRRYYLNSQVALSSVTSSDRRGKSQATQSISIVKRKTNEESAPVKKEEPKIPTPVLSEFSIPEDNAISADQNERIANASSIPSLEYIFDTFISHQEIRDRWLNNDREWKQHFVNWIWKGAQPETWDQQQLIDTVERYDEIIGRALGDKALALSAMQDCVNAGEALLTPELKTAFTQALLSRN